MAQLLHFSILLSTQKLHFCTHLLSNLLPGSKQYSAVCEVYRYRESGQKTVLTDAYEFPIADGEDYVMLVICVPVRWKVPE